tara:strand:+ start:1069 stop:1713 length:645 start_codon:yes stop_codon:yes gene_type:complete
MDSIRKIFDDAMKKAGISSESSNEDIIETEPMPSEATTETVDDLIKTESASIGGTLPSEDVESLWDLSELDPDIYRDVFLSSDSDPEASTDSVNEDTPTIVEGRIVSAGTGNESTSVRAIGASVRRVSLDDDIESIGEEELEEDMEENPLEEENESLDNVMEVEEDEVAALFGEKIEIRPQVRQLLDKYGTLPASQLLQEIREVNQLLNDGNDK